MRAAVVALLALAPSARAADDAVLTFPEGNTPTRLRLEVTAGGKSPAVAWGGFLDTLFAYFDRDGDGRLSPAEAARVVPLPLPGGRSVALDFAALDADRDGQGSPAEFRTYYRGRGFGPVAVVVEPAPAAERALGAALFRHLDRNRDGKLSAAELLQAPTLLRRLDEDEDEVLTAAELRASDVPIPAAGLKAPRAGKELPAATLQVPLDGRPVLADGTAFRLSADGTRLSVPGGRCAAAISANDPAAAFRAAKGFYLAQFRAAARDKPARKNLFADDPTARVLSGLFDAADRDGDGLLTRAELEAFFDLIERGVGCRVLIVASDRGRNLFDVFDANADGRLDLGELTRTARTLPADLDREHIPASYRLTISRGPVGDSFGPVPFGAAASRKKPEALPAGGPRWFRAMDRNGDGYVSRQEFVGPPELFSKLDTDGDERISTVEAELGDRR